MDSQLASVLTRGSLDVQNGSQCAEGSGPVTKMFVDPEDRVHLPAAPGNLQPPVTAAQTIRTQAPSVNGQQPEVGGTSQPSSQEPSQIGGFRQPITVKTGVPVVDNQPMRIKIVVPPRHKGPITNSAISLTKDFTLPHPGETVMLSEKSWAKTHTSAVTSEGDTEVELFHVMKGEKGAEMFTGKRVLDVKIVHIDGLETHSIPRTNTVKILTQRRIHEESTEREMRKNLPLILRDMGLIPRNTFNELRTEEQTEPLDLSLPNKREDRERRCGRFQHDSGGEGSLIMEVDEYEGDGDRDIVEEDEDGTMDVCARCVLKDSLLSTSALASLSPVDCDNKDLLLIDDQGIPYTLSHDGHKIPQVDISPSSTDPQSDPAGSPGTERPEESPEGTSSGPSFSQSSETAQQASSLDLYPSSTAASDLSLLGTDQMDGPGVMEGMTNPEHSVDVEPNSCVKEAVFSSSPLISTSTQPVQMLTNPSINVPFLLLSPSSSSAPVSLPLSLSVPQSSPGASTPMFLLLSSVPSSSGESTSTSTPIAVLDPSTGQLSQITAASAPISLPLSSGQVGALGSHVPPLSNPVITLSTNNTSVMFSGTSNIKSSSVLTSLSVPSNVHTQGSAPLSQTHISHSDSNPGSEAILVKDVSSEMNKQSTVPESSPQAQPSSVTHDPSTQPSSEASAQPPASESNVTPSDHLPLDDHLYFSNTAAPPSPPIGPMFPPSNLDPLDSLDPISPSGSPDSMSSRRVLYCPLCPRVFFYLSDLERHAITHSQKKPHVCQQCGKAFKRSSHLQRHKHIHTGQRNFVCPICAKRFREAGELQRHQRVHTGEKPYQCQLCHTRFAERNTLRRHTKRKHPYHQAAMEMLNERRDRGGGGRRDDGEVGGSAVQEEEESAEWYSSTVSNLEHSESEVET